MAVGQSVAAASHRVRTPPSIVRLVILTGVSRTIGRIVAALNTRAVAGRLHNLDVVLVSQTLTALGIALPAGSTARVVLATLILRVQPGQVAGPDASRHC